SRWIRTTCRQVVRRATSSGGLQGGDAAPARLVPPRRAEEPYDGYGHVERVREEAPGVPLLACATVHRENAGRLAIHSSTRKANQRRATCQGAVAGRVSGCRIRKPEGKGRIGSCASDSSPDVSRMR